MSDQTQEVAKVNVDYEKVQESLPNMRLKESQIASELQKHTINLDNQEKEIDRANSAVEETQIRIQQIKNDMDREQFLFDDANENMERVREEKSILEKQQGDLFLDTNEKDKANDISVDMVSSNKGKFYNPETAFFGPLPQLKSPDGKYTVGIMGLIQLDAGIYNQEANYNTNNDLSDGIPDILDNITQHSGELLKSLYLFKS